MLVVQTSAARRVFGKVSTTSSIFVVCTISTITPLFITPPTVWRKSVRKFVPRGGIIYSYYLYYYIVFIVFIALVACQDGTVLWCVLWCGGSVLPWHHEARCYVVVLWCGGLRCYGAVRYSAMVRCVAVL